MLTSKGGGGEEIGRGVDWLFYKCKVKSNTFMTFCKLHALTTKDHFYKTPWTSFAIVTQSVVVRTSLTYVKD